MRLTLPNKLSPYRAFCFIIISLVFLISSVIPSRAQKRWIPDFVVNQVSGSLGTYSSGIGYYAFEDRARISAHCGIVHEGRQVNLSVASVKMFYRPVTLTAWNRIKVSPADIGVIGSYVAGSLPFGGNQTEMNKIRGAWWRPGFAAHVALENCVTYEFKKGQLFKSLTGYLEVNTNEAYFLEFIRNSKDRNLWEILKFGTGVRLTF